MMYFIAYLLMGLELFLLICNEIRLTFDILKVNGVITTFDYIQMMILALLYISLLWPLAGIICKIKDKKHQRKMEKMSKEKREKFEKQVKERTRKMMKKYTNAVCLIY